MPITSIQGNQNLATAVQELEHTEEFLNLP
jgi:hypothetical protein